MNILLAHNFYQQPGGEDQVFHAEAALLRRFGHRVTEFTLHNDAIDSMSRLALTAATFWNRTSYRAIRQVLRDTRPDIAHFHNTFPLISPAGYAAARAEGVPVVQTLHNYRFACPNGLFLRDGRACQKCLGKTFAWPGVVHGCYRNSRTASAAVAAMAGVHRLLGTYHRHVDVYIVLAEFARRQWLTAGLPLEKLVVKPNFLDPDPGFVSGPGRGAVFIGRLSEEKGIRTLLAAWPLLQGEVPLEIIGDGPFADQVQSAAAADPSIHWHGRQPPERVCDLLGAAAVAIIPSECYENFPRVIAEAYAKGTPLLASNHGALADLVLPGRTGELFTPGDPSDLAARLRQLLTDPTRLQSMRHEARHQYEALYTGTRNHEQLLAIYHQARRSTKAPSVDAEHSEPQGAAPCAPPF